MYYPLTHYYFLKKINEKLNSLVINNIEITDDLTFNAANFNNTTYFYKLISFGRDKYNIAEKYEEGFNSFIADCLLNINKNNDFNALYFIYGMVSTHILDSYLKQLTDAFKNEKLNYLTASNMGDYYIGKINDIDLCKTTIYKEFKNSFEYPDYLDDLIHSACIRNFKLMASNNYFKKAYKRKKAFYKRYTKASILTPFLWLGYIIKFKKIKFSQFRHRENINFDILNTKKLQYKLNGTTVNYTFNEVINAAYDEALNVISKIDDYVFNNKDKGIREYFNIPKDKEM